MGKRSDPDPLVRILTDKYRLNILRVPRGGIAVGDLFLEEEGDYRRMGAAAKFFDPPLVLPPESDPEPFAEVNGSSSMALSAGVAASPAAALLTALGVVGVTKISAKLRGARDTKVSFAVVNATLQSTDIVTLGEELSARTVQTGNALYQPGRQFFISTAVAAASGIRLRFEGGGQVSGELAAEVANVAGASTDVSVEGRQAGQVTVMGKTVVFGIAVMKLAQMDGSLRLNVPNDLRAVRRFTVDHGAPITFDHELLGGPDGDLFVDVNAEE